MEYSTYSYCHGCKTSKLSSEFTSYETENISKEFKTCNKCRQRFAKKRKKLTEINKDQPNDQFEIVDIDFLSEIVMNLLKDDTANNSLHLHCGVKINNHENPKEFANKIIEFIEDADKYNWTYQRQYAGNKTTTYWYYCSQRDNLTKKPRKHSDPLKQRDVLSKERYNCDGVTKISINEHTQIAEISLYHKDLHVRPVDKSLPQNVKEFIEKNISLLPREIYARLVNEGLDISIKQSQVHFWWTHLGQGRYKRCEDAFDSTCLWLLENDYSIILKEVEPVRALAFETNILKQLNELGININEYGIDATYNTNNMGFELYVLHAEVNGTGFPLSYLFLENNGKCKDGLRTSILQKFLTIFRDQGLQPKFFLTDKDFSQINAARFTWPHAKIQLCRWHIKKAINTRLSSNKNIRSSSFNPLSEFGRKFPFDGIQQATQFCPKEFREPLWKIMDKHLHQHPLIPTSEGNFLSKDDIYEASVQEMYRFCKDNSLISLWQYLWTEWYCESKWSLWARSPCEGMISVLKTTMFIEGHWKTIKRDFLYKFFRPRMDLVAYILMKQVVVHQLRKLQQIHNKREKPDWVKDFKSKWKSLSKQPISNEYITDVENWICGCPYYLTNRFRLCKHLVQQKGIVTDNFFENIRRNYQPPFLIEYNQLSYIDDNKENYHINSNIMHESAEEDIGMFDDLIDTTKKALALLEEQKSAGNVKWCKSVMKSFNGITKLVKEVEKYQRKRTMPLTWKGHTDSTRYLQ
ncbi:unnamed protein product [Rhizophagus irregularis]|nr:unnamed protein product [Rhizophagus irregularis]CAB4423648.1 unnamed protein product [Rhizophagus irregularis]